MPRTATLLLALPFFACATEPVAHDRRVGLSLVEAQEVADRFEKKLVANDVANPLRQPKSLDDVLAILKSDQLDLFAAGAAYAHDLPDPSAPALEAQIELAWGEAQTLLADLFADTARREQVRARRLELRNASGDLTAPAQAALAALEQGVVEKLDLADALNRLAAEHVAQGASIARKIIATSPKDYVGYRLAADYYRMRGEWPQFDEMVAKIEATNPASNGLLFLRGMSEIQRAGRPADGAELLRKALQVDPNFVRAQAELVLAAARPGERFGELQALELLNPHHQIVQWLGPSIRADHELEQKDPGHVAPPPKDG